MPLPSSRVVHGEVVLCVGIEVVLRAWSRFLVTDDPVAAARSIADSSPGSGTGRCLVAPAAGVSASGYWCRFRLGWCRLGRWCRRCSRSRRCDTRCLVGQSAALLARIVSLNDDVVPLTVLKGADREGRNITDVSLLRMCARPLTPPDHVASNVGPRARIPCQAQRTGRGMRGSPLQCGEHKG